MEEGAGYSQVNQPAWDKPLWDAYPLFGNEDWMMEAPSFAGAVDLVVQVVATVATAPVGGWGGAALGAAIGSVDDLLFTALELGTGYIIPEQALLQVGQTLLKAGVQFAAQGAFQGYEKQAGGLMAAWGKDFLGEATVNVLQQFTTNVANGFIDAHSLEVEDGKVVGWHFDGDQWAESVYGERALAGYAGSFARSATQNLLKSTAVGFLGEGANNYNALIKTASALAGEGVGSLIDGEFSINVLNLTDILSPFIEDKDLLAKMDMGLFSMNFARDKNGNLKTTSRINSAGANVGGLVGLARSVAGLTEAYDNIRIGLSGADEKTAIALRGISTNGQEASQSLFDQILSGETTLQEAYRVAVGEIAKTTSTADGKEISLNMEDLNGFELGVVLAHEAMRNGRNDGKEGQRQETRDSVLAHSAHALEVLKAYGAGAVNSRFAFEAALYEALEKGEISQEQFDTYSDLSYDSTKDYLKVILQSNGGIRFVDDGEEDLTLEDWRDGKWGETTIVDYEEFIKTADTGSRTFFWSSVLQEMGISNLSKNDLDQSLQKAGWTWDEVAQKWNGNWNDLYVDSEGDKWQSHWFSGLSPLKEGDGADKYHNTPAYVAKLNEADRKHQERLTSIANFFGFGVQTPTELEGLNGRIINRVKWLLHSNETWPYGGSQVSYIHNKSCQNVVSWIADDLGLNYVNQIFKETADTEGFETGSRFNDIDKKLAWFRNNPDKGLFLGSYVFKENNQLIQLQSTGNSEFDTAPGYGLDNLQEYLDAGQVVISWTPRNHFLSEEHKTHFGRTVRLLESGLPDRDTSGNYQYDYLNTSAHIAFVSNATNSSLLTYGPYLSQGGLVQGDLNNANKYGWNGMVTQRYTTGWELDKRRSFYLFVIYQGANE
jgi:hypothetical protein